MTSQWCHHGVMDLTSYVDNLRHELAVAAEAGGDDARALAERLTAPLDSAVRLLLLAAPSPGAAGATPGPSPGPGGPPPPRPGAPVALPPPPAGPLFVQPCP